MTLIKSISGIRGTIGGKPGESFTPLDIVKFASAFGTWLKQNLQKNQKTHKVVIGRDSRISGKMVSGLVIASLEGLGIDVVNLGPTATPTVEIAVTEENADGGIVITASHNPAEWNALKLLNNKGEFISQQDGETILKIASSASFVYAPANSLGHFSLKVNYCDVHIDKILSIPIVDIDSIKARNFKVVIDCVNSIGGIILPKLLNQLGVSQVIKLNCEASGHFAHNPEPIPEHLTEIAEEVSRQKADLGIVVDPDVDRLALVCEDGSMFGEEYTLVAVADYVLKHKKGNTVSNLSSTRALRDVTEIAGGKYFASAVGEVNVVKMMKETEAVIGGEGNGGIIYPELHYGRDAMVGIALFLTHLAKSNKSCAQLRKTYPQYYIVKNKIELTQNINVEDILHDIKKVYKDYQVNTIDGVKIEFGKEWVHLRKSNTEAIIRIYAESTSIEKANKLSEKIMNQIMELSC